MDSIVSVQNKDVTTDGKEFTKVLELSKKHKLYKQTTRLNLGKYVKIYHGITLLQHLVDPKRMALLKEPWPIVLLGAMVEYHPIPTH